MMDFFYNLNKKIADIVSKEQLNEDKKAKPDFLDVDKDGDKEEPMKKALKDRVKEAEEQLDEKWAGDVKLDPAKKGMFKGKTKADLEKQLAALHKTGPHKKGSPEYTKQQELNFAIRAKSGWKEGEEELDEEYMGFEKTKAAVAKNPKVKDPAAVAAAIGRKKYGKEKFQKAAAAGKKMGECELEPWKYTMKENDMEEGNAFTAKLKSTPKGGKFKLGDKEFTDTSSIEEKKEISKKHKGTAFDPEFAKTMFAGDKDKTKTGHEVKDTGYSKRYTKSLADEPETDDDNDGAPKKKGRKAVGAGKGKKIGAKHSGTSKLARKDSIKETDLEEKAVSVAQRRAAGIAHAAQKGEIPKSKLRGASKEMAKMAKGELHKFAATKEKGLPKKVKHKEVEETTTSGSVAPVANAPKTTKSGGIEFGKGVYEEMNSKLETLITEGMNVSVNMSTGPDGEPHKSITVSAEGAEAEALAQLLNLAGLQGKSEHACPTCGEEPCGCAEVVDENAPDWPTDDETTGEDDPNLERWSGGLNKPKSTGQTTVPVVNRDPRRGSYGPMHEEKDLGMSLYKELQTFKPNK